MRLLDLDFKYAPGKRPTFKDGHFTGYIIFSVYCAKNGYFEYTWTPGINDLWVITFYEKDGVHQAKDRTLTIPEPLLTVMKIKYP